MIRGGWDLSRGEFIVIGSQGGVGRNKVIDSSVRKLQLLTTSKDGFPASRASESSGW